MDMSELDTSPPELADLANQVGEFIRYWGFKKVHGRIWTHIYLSDRPIDAGYLMKKLKVSKALISLSLNELLKYQVIAEAGKSARGTTTYCSNPNLLDVVLNVLKRREMQMLASAKESHKLASALDSEHLKSEHIDRQKLDSMGRMIQQAQNGLNSLLELTTLDMAIWQDLNEVKK